MPVVTPSKNIWVAAGEGDIARVQYLIENECISPNVPDPHTYTPMHAAASYGQIQVLEYLASKGGDVNVKDGDGETPLFTVESVDVARWLIEHGASLDCRNQEGNTPAQHLAEEFPFVSTYLHTLDPSAPLPGTCPPAQPSNYSTDQAASQLTNSIFTDAYAILQRAEAEGRDPEAELQAMVGRVVLGGLVTGVNLAQNGGTEIGLNESSDRRNTRHGDDDAHDSKRSRYGQGDR